MGYVGRLSNEKGFDLLLEVARRHPEIPFRFAGTPREDEVVPTLPNVSYDGHLTPECLTLFYLSSRFIVIPSRCYEGFPMVLLEASSLSRCCVAPNHGAFPDLMTDPESNECCGLLFEPVDINDLEQKVVGLWNDIMLCHSLGEKAEANCRKRFLKRNINQAWNLFLHEINDKKCV